MIKYRTGGCGNNPIEEVEVDKETDKFVWMGKNRFAKTSSWHKYWDTWEDAYDYLIEKANKDISYANSRLEEGVKRLDLLKTIFSERNTNNGIKRS